MFRRSAQLAVATVLAFCPVLLSGQAAPPQYYLFCMAQAPATAPGGMPTIYFSGIMQGPAASIQNFRNGFDQFLMQRYATRGGANCSPTNSMVNAQTAMTRETTAFRNAKRNVVETGWTESAASAGAPAQGGANPLSNILGGARQTAAPAATTAAPQTAPVTAAPAQTTAGATVSGAASARQGQGSASNGAGNAGGGGGAANSNNNMSGVLGAIFGTSGGSNGGGAAGGAKPAQGQTPANGRAGVGGSTASTGGANTGGANTGGGSNQSAYGQVSGTLTSIFGNKSTAAPNGAGTNGARGAQPGAGNPPAANPGAGSQPGAAGTRGIAPAQNAAPDGSLGTAQFGTTKLIVYGCGRQDMQVACVTELTNQNARETLVQSADVWKDAFIVDDRGDRHSRTSAFFLNIDSEQRQQLDISNGKTAKFILMFDNVPIKVQKITLRSQSGGLDVEEISLIAPDGSSPTPQQ